MFGSPPRLGRVQLRIMQVLWRTGQATAREITDALDHEQPIAHSTVQTLLRKMEAKGAITHDVADRTFVFRPLLAREAVTESALQDILSRVFCGSVVGLVAQLLADERISAEELDRLRNLIDATRSSGAAESTEKKEDGDGRVG
ncbi:MAG TPA: BlaI/MecI/CopY family transcriptional regulator [Chthonomonadaceae bacterium]|nr:BlaI/MecI/CopY family transcriptional regulator [Chthonomonadaceae bacterium]